MRHESDFSTPARTLVNRHSARGTKGQIDQRPKSYFGLCASFKVSRALLSLTNFDYTEPKA
jgi:hypothetical protein